MPTKAKPKPKPKPPIAFLCYVRSDDEHEAGRLTQFRERLSGEVHMQTGHDFPIFQDRNDIRWGQQWEARVEEALDGATFLIPIVTPSLFESAMCRKEISRFLGREKELARNDLILPIYYVSCPILEVSGKRNRDKLVKAISSHQWADWRELRFEPMTSPQVSRTLASLAKQVIDALQRETGEPARMPPKPKERKRVEKPAERESQATNSGSEGGAQAEKGRRKSPLTEPVTLVVDAMCRGDYETLTEALKHAEPGSRIVIRPGLYREGVVIDRPVEIVGEGPQEDCILQAEGADVVLFRASMGRITNLTLRQCGGGNWYGVDITQGALVLEDCDITSESLSCVAVRGRADPRVRRNRIHGGKSGGIFVYENAQGTIEENEVFGTALAGIAVAGSGNPVVRRNRIHDSKQGGVHVYEDGRGTFEENDIFDNALAGIAIKQRGNAVVRRNQVHDGKAAGIFVYENGQGTLEENDIFANASAGIAVSEGGNPVVRRNQIRDSKQSGVHVYERGLGTFEDNDILSNAHAGVAVREGSRPKFLGNRIKSNRGAAIRVYEGGEVEAIGNDLRENARGAWAIAADCLDKVKRSDNIE